MKASLWTTEEASGYTFSFDWQFIILNFSDFHYIFPALNWSFTLHYIVITYIIFVFVLSPTFLKYLIYHIHYWIFPSVYITTYTININLKRLCYPLCRSFVRCTCFCGWGPYYLLECQGSHIVVFFLRWIWVAIITDWITWKWY